MKHGDLISRLRERTDAEYLPSETMDLLDAAADALEREGEAVSRVKAEAVREAAADLRTPGEPWTDEGSAQWLDGYADAIEDGVSDPEPAVESDTTTFIGHANSEGGCVTWLYDFLDWLDWSTDYAAGDEVSAATYAEMRRRYDEEETV